MNATLDVEALLVHGPFLKRLARSLLGDEHAADDVVQQTWLTTLDKPPRQAGSLRSFMATVARNLALEGGRRGSRRRQWEAAAARPEALPSTEEIVQREAVCRQVVEALLDLDERYRDVLLLRFYESMAPRHIAQQLELPVETVRTRIKRGLAALSDRLDEHHDGDRKTWAAALVPLAFPQSASAGLGAALASSLTSFGPVAQFAAAGLVLAGLAAGAAWWLDRDAPPADPQQSQMTRAGAGGGDGGAAPASDLLLEGGEGDEPSPAPTSLPAGAEPLTAALPPLVEGRLLDAEGGTPLAGARVLLAGVALDDVQLLATATREELSERWIQKTVVTDAQGRYRIGGLSRGVWILATAAEGARPFSAPGVVLVDVPPLLSVVAVDMVRRRLDGDGMEIPAFHALEQDGVLALDVVAPAVPVHDVRVQSTDGEPLVGARVLALSPAASMAMQAAPYPDWSWRRLEPNLHELTTDEQGLASDVTAQPGGLLLVSAPGHRSERLTFPAGESLPTPLRVTLQPALAVTVSGRVVDRDGRPVAGAVVALGDFGVSGLLHDRFDLNLQRWDAATTRTDGNGRFAFEDHSQLSRSAWDPTPVSEGMSFAVLACSEGSLSTHQSLVATAAQPHHDVELVLRAGSLLEVTLLDRATLGPAQGAMVSYQGEDLMLTQSVDEDGSVSFRGKPHGPVPLTIRRLGYEPVTLEERDWRGETLELLVDFEPVGWQLSVGVRDLSGQALAMSIPALGDEDRTAWLAVQAWPVDPASLLEEGRADWRRLDLGGIGGRWIDGRSELAFDRSWQAEDAWIVVTCEDDVLASAHAPRGLDTLELVARSPWLDGQALPVNLEIVQAGEELSFFGTGAQVLDARTGAFVSRLTWDLFESGMFGMVPGPGVYDVILEDARQATLVLEDLELDSPSDIRVELAAPARLQVDVTAAGGLPVNAVVALFDGDGRCLMRQAVGSDGTRQCMVPGVSSAPYRLVAWSEEGVDAMTVHLAPGEDRSAELRLAPAASLRLVSPALGEAVALLRVANGEGQLLVERQVGLGDRTELTGEGLVLPAAAGRYEVTLTVAGRDRVVRTVELGSAGQVTLSLD
jgi:RNA polymerase sigma-70 factor (ECF subfamily)